MSLRVCTHLYTSLLSQKQQQCQLLVPTTVAPGFYMLYWHLKTTSDLRHPYCGLPLLIFSQIKQIKGLQVFAAVVNKQSIRSIRSIQSLNCIHKKIPLHFPLIAKLESKFSYMVLSCSYNNTAFY